MLKLGVLDKKKYFEVGSCSILGDAQSRRLGIRAKGKEGNYLVTTLNNTVLATPRGMIAVLENNYQADGSVKIPKALQPYMGGKEIISPKKINNKNISKYYFGYENSIYFFYFNY